MLRNCSIEKVILWIGLGVSNASTWVYRIADRFFDRFGNNTFLVKPWAELYREMLRDPSAAGSVDPVLSAMHHEINGNEDEIDHWAEIVLLMQKFYNSTCFPCCVSQLVTEVRVELAKSPPIEVISQSARPAELLQKLLLYPSAGIRHFVRLPKFGEYVSLWW